MRISATPFSDTHQLDKLDRLIAAEPDAILLHFGRACCLDDLGRSDEAVQAYMDVLKRDPAHIGALANLGTLFFERGRTDVAGHCFLEAVRRHPDDQLAQLNAAEWYAQTLDRAAAERAYARAIEIEPKFVHAHLGLARLYAEAGDHERSNEAMARAYEFPVAYTYPYRGSGEALKLLHLVSATGGEIVSNLFFDDTVVERCVLLADSVLDTLSIPPFHVLFNAIGDVDQSPVALERAKCIASATSAAVINDPAVVLRTSRVEMMRRVREIPDVAAARTERFARSDVTAPRLADAGFRFPLLVRSPGHHGGDHFVRVESADEIAAGIDALPGAELLVIEFIDVRGRDACARKYRAVCVDGHIFPVHLAISTRWKVHYFSADMDGRPDHQAEEAAYLSDMASVVGPDGMAALRAVFTMMGLDYGGVDFTVAPDGSIVVFEANATMAVYPPSPQPQWNYRREAVDRVIAAVRAMFVSRAKAKGYRSRGARRSRRLH